MRINCFPSNFAKDINIQKFVKEINNKAWNGNISFKDVNGNLHKYTLIEDLFDKFDYIYTKANIPINLNIVDSKKYLNDHFEPGFSYEDNKLWLPSFFDIENEYGNCIDIYLHEITHVLDYLLGIIIYNKAFYSMCSDSAILQGIKNINISDNYFYPELKKRGFDYTKPEPLIRLDKDSYKYTGMLDIIDGFGKGYFLKEYKRIEKSEGTDFHINCIGTGHGEGYTSDEEIAKEFFANFVSISFIEKSWIPFILITSVWPHFFMNKSVIAFFNKLSNDLQKI